MRGILCLACVWTLLIGLVCSDIQFLERHEGESVVLPCATDPSKPPPFGFYLKRQWLRKREVLFKYMTDEFTVQRADDKNRTSVSGDPGSHSVNVTISQLRAGDTDRYACEFVVESPSSEDLRLPGKTEFFLLVTGDALGSVDMGLVETCAGGSAVLPCLPPHGGGLAVEGVTLKRQRGQAPVEVLYHSKRRHSSSPPSSSSSSSQFPVEKVQMSTAPGPTGITYNLALQQLQPDDSGLYSCQLLLHGRPDSSTSLGRQVFFVSVQGGQCGCSSYSSYSTLLYALSAAVAALLFLLLIGCVAVCRGKARRSVKSHPQAPIYEEMVGMKPASQKLASRNLEEMCDESSEYRNCTALKKSCPNNHYESPSGALFPRRESPK